MTFTFTGSEDVVNELRNCSNDKVMGKNRDVTVTNVQHFKGYSTCQIDCKGELTDLIWLGYWAHYLKKF